MNAVNNLGREFVYAADFVNLISGGTSMNAFTLLKSKEYYLLNVKAPGITPEQFKVEVNNNMLVIFHYMDLETDVHFYKKTKLPRTIATIAIPYDVDITKITAHYENNNLKVYLPYNAFSKGYHKDVDIFDGK